MAIQSQVAKEVHLVTEVLPLITNRIGRTEIYKNLPNNIARNPRNYLSKKDNGLKMKLLLQKKKQNKFQYVRLIPNNNYFGRSNRTVSLISKCSINRV
jgi:hypothetical protein